MSQENQPIAEPKSRSLPRNVKLLGMASLLNDIASEMIYPLLPTFLTTVLKAGTFELGMIEGAADSAASLLKLWSGGWSDKARGRRGFVLFGYGMTALVRPMIGLAGAWWQVFSIRLTDRIGKGIRSSPRDALIADSTEPEVRGRAYGFNRAMDHLGAAIGPLLASAFLWLAPGQYRLLFVLTLVPGLLVVALLMYGLEEKPRHATVGRKFEWTLRPFDRNFRLFLVAMVVFTLGNSSDAFLLVRAGELGVPIYLLPALWCAFHIVKSTGSYAAGHAVDKFGPRRLIFIGWLIYALIYLGFALASGAWQIFALFLVYGIFYALTEPAEKTLVANLVGRERQGLAFGWYNFAVGIAALPSSMIFGWLYQQYGGLVAFGWGAGLAMLAVVLLAGVKPMRSV